MINVSRILNDSAIFDMHPIGDTSILGCAFTLCHLYGCSPLSADQTINVKDMRDDERRCTGLHIIIITLQLCFQKSGYI